MLELKYGNHYEDLIMIVPLPGASMTNAQRYDNNP